MALCCDDPAMASIMPLSNEFAAKNPSKPEEGLEDGTEDGCMEGLAVGRNDGVADGIGEEDGENVAAGGPGREIGRAHV